jgi:uncharacterized protein (TIGR00156 family)
MKRILLLAAISSAAFISAASIDASAQFVGSGNPATAETKWTVAEILKNGIDDQRVVIRGNVLRRLYGDKYMFSDGTGEIRVDIDQEEWPKEPVTDKTTVELIGKIDTEWSRPTEIDVKVLRVVK